MQAIAKVQDAVLQAIETSLAGQLAPSSQATYKRDLQHFATWIQTQGKTFGVLTLDDLKSYRLHLAETFAKSTAGRMLTVARIAVKEGTYRGLCAIPDIERLKGFKLDNESPRTALDDVQCRQLLSAIEREAPRGKRDYALLALLIRTGIRRAELVAANIGDLGSEGGHFILTIQHGKGDKRRIVKVPPDLHRAIQEYLMTRGDVAPNAPLFVGIRKDGAWKETPIHMYGGLSYILQERARVIGLHLTPHDLRATFATLALEGRAPLQKVQYAMGHSDPRTTERYHRKKQNLDDNATDYIRTLSD